MTKVERYVINAHMLPFFGPLKLSEIDVRVIERYNVKRQKDGVSPRAINFDLAALSVIFKLATQLGYARANPLRDVPKMKEVKRPPRFLSEDEVGRLLNAARPMYLYPLIVTAL